MDTGYPLQLIDLLAKLHRDQWRNYVRGVANPRIEDG